MSWARFIFGLHLISEGFPGGSAGKEFTYNVGDLGSIPGLGRSSGEGKDYPLQYSGLENSMDCIVHGVAKSWTRLSDFHFSSDGKTWAGVCGPDHSHSPICCRRGGGREERQ